MRLTVLAACLLTAACRGTDPGEFVERINHGIVEGNAQVQEAGDPTFQAAVVEKIAKERIRVAARPGSAAWLAGLLSPREAWAQGAQVEVKGSPVEGAVVCVDEDSPLVPFARCTNTNAEGKAFFFLRAPTTAGEYEAEIRGTLDGLPAVFDTARMTVVHTDPDPLGMHDFIAMRASPAVFQPVHFTDPYTNPIPYRIPTSVGFVAQDTVLGSEGARTVVFDAAAVDSVWRTVKLTGRDGPIAQFTYRLVIAVQGINSDVEGPRIQAVICGLDVDPCVSETWQDP